MDWQQKAAALDALAEIEIKIRKPGDWYVSQRVEIKNDCFLEGAYGNGDTPMAAIEDHWNRLVTDIECRPLYLVARAGHPNRRAVRWNGFMWQDVPEPERATAGDKRASRDTPSSPEETEVSQAKPPHTPVED